MMSSGQHGEPLTSCNTKDGQTRDRETTDTKRSSKEHIVLTVGCICWELLQQAWHVEEK